MRTILCTCLMLASLTAAVRGEDWPQYRGPNRDARSTETGLLKEWPKGGPTLLWDAKKVNDGKTIGTGYSSIAVHKGKLYTMGDHVTTPDSKDENGKKVERKGDGYVYCVDAATGKVLWGTKIAPYFYNSFGSGARGTPTVVGNRVYAISPQGILACLDADSGSILWQKDFPKDFGGRMMSGWGYSESPYVDGDKLICTPGGKKAALVALNKETGETIWKCELAKDSGAGYASIVPTTVGGIKQYITYLGKDPGLVGVDANTGKHLWSYAGAANGTANCPSALVHDDYVFTSSSYGSGAALLKLIPDGKGGIEAKEQYLLTNKQLNNHHGGMVMVGDYIYGGHGQNDGKPFCLEWKTGKMAWGPDRGPGSGSASVVYADGNIYFRYQGGTVALIEASPKALDVKSLFEPRIGSPDWAHPVVANGKLYLRGEDTIRCYDLQK